MTNLLLTQTNLPRYGEAASQSKFEVYVLNLLKEYLGPIDGEMEVAVLNIISKADRVSDDLLDSGVTNEQEILQRFASDPALLRALLEYHLQRAASQFSDDLDSGKITDL